MELGLFVIATVFIVPATAIFMIGMLITMYINDKIKNNEKLKVGSILGFSTGLICITIGTTGVAFIIVELIKYLFEHTF